MFNRRALLHGTAVAAGLAVAPARAQTFPARPIRLVVGFAPGGGSDVIARLVATRLSERIGQPVVVENRPGAAGTVAAGQVAQAQPDGYTLLAGASSTNVIAPLIYRQLPYANEDLIGVNLLASFPHVVAVTPSLPITKLQDLIDYDRQHPGELTFASAGNGSTPHLAGEMFNALTGTRLRHVPYRGAAASLSDLLAGRVSVSFDTTGTMISTLVSGGLRPLAIAARQRFARIPSVPTSAEAGVPGFEMATWVAIFAPARTPPDIVRKLHEDSEHVLQQPDFRAHLRDVIGCEDTATSSAEAFQAFVRDEHARYARLLATVRVTLD